MNRSNSDIHLMRNNCEGFTLIEIVVSICILVILSLAVCQFFISMINGIAFFREETTVSSLADQYLEIAKNLPYSKVGTINGNPNGSLPDLPNAETVNFGGVNYKIYYVVNYVENTGPDYYKQIKLYVTNINSRVTSNFLTDIAPEGLEGLINGGALSIKVFNSVGQPVPNASIQIVNTNISPAINLSRLTDSNGNWTEVGLPDSANSYHIIATKTSYSTDSTYPITAQNPNPIKPNATISNGQVTQVSFSIDQLSSLSFSTMNQSCSPLSGVGLEVVGSKIIGTPNILKFDNTYTSNSDGNIHLSNIEWDNYSAAPTSSSYMIYGSSPVLPAFVLPNTSQNFNLILGPETANSLLVEIKDSSTGNPIQGTTVNLQNISSGNSTSQLTGGSILSQQDWSGGSGQTDFNDSTKYYQDDGNISYTGVPSGLRLAKNGSSYSWSGSLVSSTFDTGTNLTSYTNLTWQPTSQDPATSIRFQIATNNDDLTWNYSGPDGTSNTYYTTSGDAIDSADNNNRYVRYKLFLSTNDVSKTPVLTSVSLNYVSGCSAPGQAIFTGLQGGQNIYQLTVSMPGYQSQTINNLDTAGYNVLKISLSH